MSFQNTMYMVKICYFHNKINNMPEQNQQYENSLELFCFFLLVMHAYNRLADVEFYVSCRISKAYKFLRKANFA